MARIEDYIKMNVEQLEGAITNERRKIRKAKTEIALLEKLKIANQSSKANDDQRNENNHNDQSSDFHHQ